MKPTKQIPWNKGLKTNKPAWNSGKTGIYSKNTLEKMSKAGMGRKSWNKGKAHLKAEKNPHWGGGNIKYKVQIAKIRDDYTCQICGLKDIEIVTVDHIRPNAMRPDLYLSLDNLMTLCPNCHARKTKIDRKNIALFNKEKNNGK